jgi:hypothetical protein
MEITTAAQILESINSPVLEIPTVSPQSNVLQEALKVQAYARGQVKKDIAEMKALGHPFYYLLNGKLIRENADGSKFYCAVQEDGTEMILSEVESFA